MSKDQVRRLWNRRALLSISILFPVEVFCALLAYHTMGEIDRGLLLILVVLADLVLIASLLFRRPRATCILMFIFGLLVIPQQLWLGARLVMLNYEVRRIICFVEDQKARTGHFPDDLSSYEYTFASSKSHLQLFTVASDESKFAIHWFVGTPSTSHWYDSKTGWGYYPD